MATNYNVYLGNYAEGIYHAKLDTETGTLSQPQLAGEVRRPAYMILNRAKDRLYCVGEIDEQEHGGIWCFARDTETGALQLLGYLLTGEGPLCHLSLDAAERRLFTVSYREGRTFTFALDENGVPCEVLQKFIHSGGSRVFRDRQNVSHAHYCAPLADDSDLLVADLGTDQIVVYRYDSEAGLLTPDPARDVTSHPGAGPRHMIYHPNGRYIYLLCEIDCAIEVYEHTEAGGDYRLLQTVLELPEGADSYGESAAIRLSPDARFLYSTNRASNDIAVYAVDAESGLLTFLAHTDSEGNFPRDINLSPDGRFLVAGNQRSDSAALFVRDEVGGLLTYTGCSVPAPSPVCVIIAE